SCMTSADILTVLGKIVCDDPRSLLISRVDLAADVSGIDVSWFREHVYVRYKRALTAYSKPNAPWLVDEHHPYPGFRLESLYYGRKNLFRIYDKTKELEDLAGRGTLTQADAALLALHKAQGKPVTRVERQCISRIPPELKTLGALFTAACDFQPFTAIAFAPAGSPLPSVDDFSLHEYLEGQGLRQHVLTNGIARTRTMLNKRGGGHAAEILRRYAPFLPANPDNFVIPDLDALYQSTLRLGQARSSDQAPAELC